MSDYVILPKIECCRDECYARGGERMIENEADEAAIRGQARDWVLRLHEHPDDAELHAAFADWIAQSDARAGAWARAERTWQVMGAIAANAPPASPPVRTAPRIDRNVRGRIGVSRRHVLIGGGAITAAGLASLALIPRGDYRTGTGERRQIALADGSRVDLDSRSAVDVAFDDSQRAVNLRQGRAFFDIAHEQRRPFVITSGETEVRVLGTAFAVEQHESGVSVAVARGKVDVRQRGAAQSVQLLPGERLTMNAGGSFTRSMVDATRIAAWRDGKIYAVGRTVGDLIEELRAYQSALLVVHAPRLSARTVTGLYHLDDPVSSLTEIVTAHGGRIRMLDRYFIYISDN